MACTRTGIVNHILGNRVNDELESGDFLVWNRDTVTKVVNEALAYVYGLRPDLFAEPKEVTLTRDSCVHTLCKSCARIVDVITVDGLTCNKVEEHKDENDDRSLDFLGCYYDDCKPPNAYWECHPTGYDPGDWQAVEGSPCTIRFKNPTPTDRDVKATVSCVPANVLTRETLPAAVCTELFTAIVDNALFRLYAIDHKDGSNPELADRHWRAFTAYMEVKFNVDFSLQENNMLLTKRRVDR